MNKEESLLANLFGPTPCPHCGKGLGFLARSSGGDHASTRVFHCKHCSCGLRCHPLPSLARLTFFAMCVLMFVLAVATEGLPWKIFFGVSSLAFALMAHMEGSVRLEIVYLPNGRNPQGPPVP